MHFVALCIYTCNRVFLETLEPKPLHRPLPPTSSSLSLSPERYAAGRRCTSPEQEKEARKSLISGWVKKEATSGLGIAPDHIWSRLCVLETRAEETRHPAPPCAADRDPHLLP